MNLWCSGGLANYQLVPRDLEQGKSRIIAAFFIYGELDPIPDESILVRHGWVATSTIAGE